MSAHVFPTITADIARRRIQQARATPNHMADQMRYLIAANRAQLAGFTALAGALVQLARRENTLFVTNAPRQAPTAESQLGANRRDNG
jgi:hypothetical protein